MPASSLADRAVDRSLERRRAAYAREVEQLVEAAFTLIERHGELEPRVGDIVRAAGLSNQAFYRHFRSKHELLTAVLDEGLARLAGYLDHRMGRAEAGPARVRAWLEGLLAQALDADAAGATRPFALARSRLAEAHPEEVAASEARLTALVQRALEEARASGALPAVDPERDAESLYHLAMGWVQARLVAGIEDRARERADAARLLDFALAGLQRHPEQG